MESFSSASYSKWDGDRAWSSQEWKTDIESYERSGRPGEISWRMMREGRLGFSHEEILLDGTDFVKNRSELISVLRKRQGLNNSSLEPMKQNWNCQWNQDHSWIGWMIRCEKDRKGFRMLQEMENYIPWYGECLWLEQWNQQYSWDRITRTIVTPLWTRQISHSNKCSTYLRNWCLNKMRSQDWKQLVGRINHGNTCHSLVTKESSTFSAQRSTSFRTLCCVLGKFLQNLESNDAWEQRLGWIKSSQNYRNFDRIDGRWATGIRVEYFPRIQYVEAQWRSQTFTVESKWNIREFYKKNHLHVDVQRHLMGIKRQEDRMRVKCWTRFSICKKIWSRTMVISRSWIREQVVLY